VRGMELEPVDPNGPSLTTSLIRDMRLAEIAAEERTKLPRVDAPRRSTAEVVKGMRPATVRRLRTVAGVYQESWTRGGKPVQAVAEALNITSTAAAKLVARARAAGLLPPTSPGVPMG
jgi:hypothetical protein